MSDISKCKGTGCPWKSACYRHTAPANELYQAYFTEVPGHYDHGGDYQCHYFWHNGQTTRYIDETTAAAADHLKTPDHDL